VLLPTKVSFTVNEATPLGDQPFVITNTDGDTATLATTFNVRDHLRIITVTHVPEISATSYAVTGTGFSATDTIWMQLTGASGSPLISTIEAFATSEGMGFTLDPANMPTTGNYDVIVGNDSGITFREINSVVIL